jgi:hypothetical protein
VYDSRSIKNPVSLALRVQQPSQSESEHSSYTVTSMVRSPSRAKSLFAAVFTQ